MYIVAYYPYTAIVQPLSRVLRSTHALLEVHNQQKFNGHSIPVASTSHDGGWLGREATINAVKFRYAHAVRVFAEWTSSCRGHAHKRARMI